MNRTIFQRTERTCLATSALVFFCLAAPRAEAQTWTGNRTTPSLTEIVAVDATGETGWLYGQEDLAGDGLTSFKQQEQSIDVRTGYASADAQRFWARVYVSDVNAVGGNVTVYVFIDADRNTMTGGTASATEIDSRFTTDSSPGGYEYVVGIKGNGSITQIWQWQPQPTGMYMGMAPPSGQAVAETGTDLDPIRINGDQHGYVQGMIDLALVGLTSSCNANIYIRSVNDTAALGAGDLEIGQVASCVPSDGNNDGIPDITIPPGGCTSDAQCPGGGICNGGTCIIPVPCVSNADCAPNQECNPDGYCVYTPGGSCMTIADCNGLVCANGQCRPCLLGTADCGSGMRCEPSGVCVVDMGTGVGGASGTGTASGGVGGASGAGGAFGLEPDEIVRGGACACRAAPSAPTPAAAALAALGLGLALRRRRRANPLPARRARI